MWSLSYPTYQLLFILEGVMSVQITSDHCHYIWPTFTFSWIEALPQRSIARLDWPDLVQCCQSPHMRTWVGSSVLGVFVCVGGLSWDGCCMLEMVVLADLAFAIPHASYILPILNYSEALTCLTLGNNTLLRQQWSLLCQNLIFRDWFCCLK